MSHPHSPFTNYRNCSLVKTYKNTFLIFEEKREHGSLFGHLRLFYGVFDDDDNDDYGEDDDNDDDWCT